MKTTAKFRVTSKIITESGTTVGLNAVTTGSEENQEFFTYTPSGTINLSIVKPETALQFVISEEYYVTFSKEQL